MELQNRCRKTQSIIVRLYALFKRIQQIVNIPTIIRYLQFFPHLDATFCSFEFSFFHHDKDVSFSISPRFSFGGITKKKQRFTIFYQTALNGNRY